MENKWCRYHIFDCYFIVEYLNVAWMNRNNDHEGMDGYPYAGSIKHSPFSLKPPSLSLSLSLSFVLFLSFSKSISINESGWQGKRKGRNAPTAFPPIY